MAKTIPGNPGSKTDMGPSKKPTGMGGRTASAGGKSGRKSA
jgi:hypothetical protein